MRGATGTTGCGRRDDGKLIVATLVRPVPSPPARHRLPTALVVVADGARPDVLAAAIDSGRCPALAALRDIDGARVLTSVFPSVTGPAYAPFLTGRFPGEVGLPALRWFDRSRTRAAWPHHARSYVGWEMQHVDGDLDPSVPTAFERAGGGLAMMNMIGRGLRARDKLTDGPRFALRAGWTHFRGDVAGWLDVDRALARRMRARIAAERPPFVFASFCGVDKVSHLATHASPLVHDALAIVDDFVAGVRDDFARAGRAHELATYVVSDHGHVPVQGHDDLADVLRAAGHRVLAHPKVLVRDPEVAVMVSGNAMAHLSMALTSRTRPGWSALRDRWRPLVDFLLARPSVDLLALPHDARTVEVHGGVGRGMAMLVRHDDATLSYRPETGDPLALGPLERVGDDDAWAAALDTDWPDAPVQLLSLAASPRCGDVLLSATRDWDFRGRFEPIPHRSSHGALHRDHMLVPFLTDRPVRRPMRRTTEVFDEAMAFLGR